MSLLSFDIEISDVFDLAPGEDLDDHAPFHISIASTAVHGGEERLWYSTKDDGTPSINITRERASELLDYLETMQQRKDVKVCAWNGLGFDLKWIGHAAEDLERAARVALASYDPMFQFFNQRGFPVGLGKVGDAMGIEQTKLMNGADAPGAWRDGRYDEVKEYVMGDSQITNQIVAEIERRGEISWITARGMARSEPMPRLKTVAEVLEDPEPDQSWMDTPMPRSKFHSWIPASMRV